MSESTIHLETSNDHFNDYLLSEEFVPGGDLISKTVLTDDRIINIICESLNNCPQDHYMAAPSEFLNKSACDILYLSKVALSEYPPIIVEVQKMLMKIHVSCSTLLNISYEKYSKYPIILMISVSTVTTSVASKLTPATPYPYSLDVPCLFWAKRCFLMSSITLSKFESIEQRDPLAAIGMFLRSRKLSITHLDCVSGDSTMKFLYKVAMTYVQQLVGEETEKAEVIQLTCDNTENQIEKIKRCVQQGDRTTIEKAMLYLDDTSDYLRRQKRKYTIGRHTTPIPYIPPIEYLKSQQSNLTMYNDYIELNDYVKR